MADFDSPVVEALVARARSPLDSGSINTEVVRALEDAHLSRRDRGQLLLAQLVLLQGSLSATEAATQASEAVELLRHGADVEGHLSALAISATISASAGDRATCLERCLDMSGLIRSHPGAAMSFRSASNFGAALIVLGAYDLAAPLFVNAIAESLRTNELLGVVASCANLAITVSRQALVAGNDIVSDAAGLSHLTAIESGLNRLQCNDLGQEMQAFVSAILADAARMRGFLDAAQAHWGDLDAFTAHPSACFTQYLCLVEAPLALRRGDISRAQLLIGRALEHLSTPHIVPLGRVDALKLRSRLHEQIGDLGAALKDAREATDMALHETSGFADLLIGQVDKRAALEHSQKALLDRANDLTEQAMVDELSQVGNRRAYEAKAEALQRSPLDTIAVLLCDVDGFKHVNDQFGHAVGDRVIMRAAAIALEVGGTGGSVFRYGGDEFVLLAASASVADAALIAERLRSAFECEPWSRLIGADLAITCSIGVWVGASSAIGSGLTEADARLYDAKNSGRNRVCATSDLASASV